MTESHDDSCIVVQSKFLDGLLAFGFTSFRSGLSFGFFERQRAAKRRFLASVGT